MIKVLINGCNGKMGQEVAKIVNVDNDCVLLGGVDKENTGEFTFPVFTDYNEITEKPDVIIDFSVPFATMNILNYAKREHIPLVIAGVPTRCSTSSPPSLLRAQITIVKLDYALSSALSLIHIHRLALIQTFHK